MYAQMVYKDRKIMELNSTILEQDKRVMDLQEFAEEKDQVIRGRNKVVEVRIFLIFQISIKVIFLFYQKKYGFVYIYFFFSCN